MSGTKYIKNSLIAILAFALIINNYNAAVYAGENSEAIFEETAAQQGMNIKKDNVYARILTAGATHIYYFTPSYSGNFVVETFGTTDTYGTVTGNNASVNPSASNDDAGQGRNFAIGFYQEAGKTTTITVRHRNSVSGTGSYELQVRDQRAQIYTFDYGSDDISTLADSVTPKSWLSSMGYAIGVHQNKPVSHLNETIAETFTRLNSEVIFFSGHGAAGRVAFINGNGNRDYLRDNSDAFTDMSNTKVAVWAACESALDPDGDGERTSVAQRSVDMGAQSAIGWDRMINVTASRKWTDQFFTALGHTMTVADAAASAGSVVLWPWDGSYAGWQVVENGNTLIAYPNVNYKKTKVNASQKTVLISQYELNVFLNSSEYEAYELKGLGTRYYKIIDGCLTNEFYNVYEDGRIEKTLTAISEDEVKQARKLKEINFSMADTIRFEKSSDNSVIKTEEHIVYMKNGEQVLPILLIYTDHQDSEGLKYQEVTCINLLENTLLDYAEICTIN